MKRFTPQQLEERRARLPKPTFNDDLPIVQRKREIAELIERNQVIVVAGETGSGKTTQLPKICLELGRGVTGMIGHTQPRRIAARTVVAQCPDRAGFALATIDHDYQKQVRESLPSLKHRRLP